MRMATTQEDPVLTAYVRHVIIGLKNTEPTKLARELGVSGAFVVNVRDGTRGVGYGSLQKIAKARFNESIDALKKAAHDWAKENPGALTVERTAPAALRLTEGAARYDSRESAVQTHVRYGEYDEATIRAAAAGVATALDAGEDPGERWWYEQIDAELKRRRKPGPRLGEVVITEDDGELVVTDASPADVAEAKRRLPKTIQDRRQHGSASDQPPGPHKKARPAKGA